MSVLTEEMRDRIRGYFPRYPSKQAVTLPALHLVQDAFRCVPLAAIEEIAELLDLQPAQVHDTMSFYGFFRTDADPLGRHRVWVCRSLPCMLKGGEELLAGMAEDLGVAPSERTADEAITLEFAECLGACDQAPCLLVDDELKGPLTREEAKALCERLARGERVGEGSA